MPMPLTGRIDGSSISKVHRGHWPELQVVPDQSGDGRPDLLDWDVTHQQWTIVASPVILERGEVVGERRPIQGMPTSVDLTGDGIGERFALDDQGFHLVDGSSEAEVLPWGWAPWVDRWFGGFVEDGVGAALVTQYAVPHEIWVIDLGEATLAR
ncbi:MAG: hypothetical protein KTR31_14705 [Myxococcales bacterium]|nr:hypothetical protein [Myxococcales bacterium]